MRLRPRPLAVAAVLVAGAVVAFGALSDGLPPSRPEQSGPEQTRREPRAPSPAPTGVRRAAVVLSVDLTASGTVWLTTAGLECDGCVVVWRRGRQDDRWLPLRRVGSDHHPGQLRMDDRGTEGLIGGAGLWATHDGGNSWARESGVPVGVGDAVQVELTHRHAWAIVRPEGRPPRLWRSSLAAPRWRAVSLPHSLDPEAPPVATGDELLVWVTREGRPRPAVTTDGGRTWRVLPPVCEAGTTTAYVTCSTRRGLELLVRSGDSWETWPLAAALGPARNLSPVTAAESVATGPDGTGYAVVRGNLHLTRDQGRGGWSRVE